MYNVKEFLKREYLEYHETCEEDAENYINTLTKNEIFDEWCEYEGLIHYGYKIRQVIENIYNIELK